MTAHAVVREHRREVGHERDGWARVGPPSIDHARVDHQAELVLGAEEARQMSTALTAAEQILALPFTANGQTLTLGDVAEIKRGYQDRRQIAMRFKSRPVIGLGVVMAQGGNVQTLGKALDKAMKEIEANLPVGIIVHRVANQPEVVDKSFEEFIASLLEALAIVLVVSFISLGIRTGLIVAFSVPLVLAITFVGMLLLGIEASRARLAELSAVMHDALADMTQLGARVAQVKEYLPSYGEVGVHSTRFCR